MRERFQIPAVLFGALLLYAALTTLLPSLVFRTPFDVDPVEQEPAGEGRGRAGSGGDRSTAGSTVCRALSGLARGLRPSSMAVRVGV